MKNRFLLFLLVAFIAASCSKDDDVVPDQDENQWPGLNEFQISVIDYFKDIALGFEFGNASRITRKWRTNMKVFVGGAPTAEVLDELENIRTEINDLVTDGFEMEIVDDSVQSNFYVFLGSGNAYAELFPSSANLVDSNWGLFSVSFNSKNQINGGRMYVDIIRANAAAQKHLLREELTQSLGLARDSPEYTESIFQSSWTTTTEFATIDKELIRLLYHPDMSIGLNAGQVDDVLADILRNE